jgi:TolB-like protein
MASKLSSFLAELKRRKVYHVAAVYSAVGVATSIAVPDLFGAFGFPTWAAPLVIVVIIIAFPIALVLAWAYEVRPEEPREAQEAAVPDVARAESERKSIVVLPFDNMSPDTGDAYFSDGLTEEIITDLSCCGLLRVISRNSAMALKDTRKGTKAIAEELDVQYVLEGSVRKAGEELLVTAQLIDATTDEHLWAERFNGTLRDVFEIQGQLSRSIVDSLKLKLTSREEDLLAARPIQDSRAYDTYLLASHEAHKTTVEGIDRAIRLTEEAIAFGGENALLSATLAQCYYLAYDMGIRHDDETFERLKSCATKALELDPDLGHSQWAMALVRFKQGDLPGFARFGRKAVRLSRDGYQQALLAFILAEMGKLREARILAEYAVDRDPLSFFSHWALGGVEIFSGQPDKGLEVIAAAIPRLAEGEPLAHTWEALAAAFAGDEDKAQLVFERVSGMGAGGLSDMCEVFRRALLGDVDGVREAANRQTVQDVGMTDEWGPVHLASSFARVGEFDEAFHWLEQAVTWGFSNHLFLSEYNRFLRPLRGDPRFDAVVERAREKERALED